MGFWDYLRVIIVAAVLAVVGSLIIAIALSPVVVWLSITFAELFESIGG